MTRKDYVAIAAALKEASGYCETQNQKRGVERAANSLVIALAADNERFDRARFLKAAGF
jgi:hypothetical protein